MSERLQFRTSHLVLLTAAVGLILGVQVAAATFRGDYQAYIERLQPVHAIYVVASVTLRGIAVCGLVALFRRWKLGRRVEHPAEYLWEILAVAAFFQLLTAFFPRWNVEELVLLFGGIGAALACRRTWWAGFYVLFGIAAVSYPLFASFSTSFSLEAVNFFFAARYLIPTIALVPLMFSDRGITGRGWLGICLLISLGALQLAFAFLFLFKLW